MKLFSKRHERALQDKKLEIILHERLQGRLWKELQQIDETIRKTDETGWNCDVTVLEEVESALKRLYGLDEFEVWDDDNQESVQSPKLKALVLAASLPHQVLDVIEVCWNELWDGRKASFQRDINSAFEDEGCPWRLADGHFFKVDSEFLEQHILSNAHSIMGGDSFKGAMDEFMEARNDLISGEFKDAILKSCKSMESVLKVALNVQYGNASNLLRNLQQSGALNDLPEEARNAVVEQLLMSLPMLRNKLSGHGQGSNVINIPKRFAALAVHLAAVFNTFLIEQYLETASPPQKTKITQPMKAAAELDDEIPF